MSRDRKFLCGACRRSFSEAENVRAHIHVKHPNTRTAIFERVEWVDLIKDDERSTADRVLDAKLDQAMGVPVALEDEAFLDWG